MFLISSISASQNYSGLRTPSTRPHTLFRPGDGYDDDNDDHVYVDDEHDIDYNGDCANTSCPDLAANVLCSGWPAPYSL